MRPVGWRSTHPLLARVDAPHVDLQHVLLVGVDVQPGLLLPEASSAAATATGRRDRALRLLLALLPPALDAQTHLHHGQVAEERPGLWWRRRPAVGVEKEGRKRYEWRETQ